MGQLEHMVVDVFALRLAVLRLEGVTVSDWAVLADRYLGQGISLWLRAH